METYYISNSECTADHPSPGFYYTVEDEDGNEGMRDAGRGHLLGEDF